MEAANEEPNSFHFISASFGWKGKGRHGSFCKWMDAGCAGKTVRSLENACHTRSEHLRLVCSGQGAIQIHVYLALPKIAVFSSQFSVSMRDCNSSSNFVNRHVSSMWFKLNTIKPRQLVITAIQ